MGIPTYFRVITQQYVGILRTTPPNICNHFFVDFNGLIHQSAYNVLDSLSVSASNAQTYEVVCKEQIEESIHEKTWSYLNTCITYANPDTITYACIDGVAPVAKMSQQRKRRYLSVLQNKLTKTPQIWDRNAISPGTTFMLHLESYLNKQFREKGTRCKTNYFSGSDKPGEGEHKIFAIIDSISKSEVAVVYGLDADLNMLSVISHHPKLYLMREPQHVQKELGTDTNGNDVSFVYLDIHLLRVSLLNELATVYNWDVPELVRSDP
jgi:5'-3' exoribonuclease 1